MLKLFLASFLFLFFFEGRREVYYRLSHITIKKKQNWNISMKYLLANFHRCLTVLYTFCFVHGEKYVTVYRYICNTVRKSDKRIWRKPDIVICSVLNAMPEWLLFMSKPWSVDHLFVYSFVVCFWLTGAGTVSKCDDQRYVGHMGIQPVLKKQKTKTNKKTTPDVRIFSNCFREHM